MKQKFQILLILAVCLCGCRKTDPEPQKPASYDNVMVLFSEGFNNLSSYLETNINDLCKGNVPFEWDRNAILVFSHTVKNNSAYSMPNAPVIFRIFRRNTGQLVRDTLKIYPENTISASKEIVSDVMDFTKSNYPASTTGIIYSSHGTGWIPSDNPEPTRLKAARHRLQAGFNFKTEEKPETKSIGSQAITGGGDYSIDIDEFADALPYPVDYIIFDACLMGGVETAWALKDKCRMLAISPTEILGKGLYVYKNLPDLLFSPGGPDVKGVCDAYFQFYAVEYSNHSATITLVDCSKINGLLEPVRRIVGRLSSNIRNLNESKVQKFFIGSSEYERCFCDMVDVFEKAGASVEELDMLQKALDDCIVYKAHTARFQGNPINAYCGLSIGMPGVFGYSDPYSWDMPSWNAELENGYKATRWNQACGMIR